VNSVHLVGFIKKKFVTMHGHMNVKKMFTVILCTPSRKGPCTELVFTVRCEGTRGCSSDITAIQVGIGGRGYWKHRNQQLVRSTAATLQSIVLTAQLCKSRSS